MRKYQIGEEANDIFLVVPANNKSYLDDDLDVIRFNIEQKISELIYKEESNDKRNN